MSMDRQVVLEAGDLLYRAGDDYDLGYIVESGEIVLYNMIDGKRVEFERRGPGSIVGELSILTNQPRTVTAEARTPCTLYRISADHILERWDQLDPILRACIETSINFTATLSKRVYDATSEIEYAEQTLFDPDALIEQFNFERDIYSAISEQQFSLVYQPVVSLSDSRIVGIEALMRWQHPTQGNIPPFKFIQAAEAIGAIGKLTEFAIAEACGALKRMRSWLSPDSDFYVAVNVSGCDIGEGRFVDYVAHMLDLHDLDPKHLKIEVTETSLVEDPETAARHLQLLRALGCGISIDDFGTGYSNLAYLKQLPLTTLKIDRAFAGDAHGNAVSRSIVSMLLGLGREMDVEIVAEGLETIDDVDVLKGLGCSFAQGFYFYKPMPEQNILKLLQKQQGHGRQVA